MKSRRKKNIGADIFRQIFDFFDSSDYHDILLKARKNKSIAGKMKSRTKITTPINTLQIVANKFGISRGSAAQLKRIKEVGNQEIINDLLHYKISMEEAYIISTGGENQQNCVYFVQHVYSRKIKIGKTKRLNRRYELLRRQSGGDIKLLLTVGGYTSEETRLHNKFRKYRCCGEWFEPAQEILDYIENIKCLEN